LLALVLNLLLERLELNDRLAVEVDYLLLNLEQSLLNCWHVSLSHYRNFLLIFVRMRANFVLDGLQFEPVKCLNILLGEILKFAFPGYLYRGLVKIPN
jgi:hypothetical protein